jgi:copper(I)-binding protein
MNTDEPASSKRLDSRSSERVTVMPSTWNARVNHLCSSVFLCGSLLLAAAAQAEVTVKDAWVRGTVPAQKSTGAFATLTSTEDAKLVGAKSPAAKVVEVHESMIHGGMAHMQAVESVALPAGKAVQLKPGGYHVMLIGLTKPIQAGEQVPITFEIEDAKGRRSTVDARAEVRPLGR